MTCVTRVGGHWEFPQTYPQWKTPRIVQEACIFCACSAFVPRPCIRESLLTPRSIYTAVKTREAFTNTAYRSWNATLLESWKVHTALHLIFLDSTPEYTIWGMPTKPSANCSPAHAVSCRSARTRLPGSRHTIPGQVHVMVWFHTDNNVLQLSWMHNSDSATSRRHLASYLSSSTSKW